MNNVKIPAWPFHLLAWFCPPALYEGIEGDLIQQFECDVEEAGEKIARRRLFLNTLRFFRPEIIFRNKFSTQLIDTVMFTNYLIIAYRNVLKNKTFSAINIIGLSIGLASCLLIFQFVSFELSYDKFNDKFERTYRITNDRFQNGKLIQHGTIMYPTIGGTMHKDYEEIEEHTRLMPGGEMNVKINDKLFRGDVCHFVDEHFLSVFSFPLLAGQRATALKDRYSVVLTEKVAKKYFEVNDGDYASLIGKTIYWGLDPQPYTVTGICGDVPANSHIQFNVLVSYATLIRPDNTGADDSWQWSDMRHYLVLKPGVDYKKLESKFPAFSERYFKGDKVSGSVEKFYLQPLREAHLYSDYEYDIAKKASGKAVWAMLVVAIFILFIAWVNYINLTTSRALERAKEVGLRKVMGALKSQLIKQFIFESMLLSVIAFLIALLLAQLLQTSFNQLVGTELSLWKVIGEADAFTIAVLCTVLIAGILLSGFYPAFVLSSYQPVTVLKGRFIRSSSGNLMRKALVVFQFTASVALITSTLIVSKQIKFMNETDLGIDLGQILVVRNPERTPYDSTFISRVESFKDRLTQLDGVTSAATSGPLPGRRLGRTFDIRLKDGAGTEHYTMSQFQCDYDFFDTYKIPLLAGRKFLASDHNVNWDKINTVVVNRNATALLGFERPQDIVGRQMTFWGRDWNVVGVVGDFHQESLRSPMEPLFFIPAYGRNATSIRLSTNDYQQLIPAIESAFKEFFPDNIFEYFFIEDRYKQQYSDEDRFAKVVNIFTVLAIIVSCLGLIGLSSYAAVQRTKEIGIRKVLGASVANILSMLSLDFVKLVAVAIVLSIPIAYYFMQNWLATYAYKIALSWTVFILPIVLILSITIVTVSSQIIKVALSNPSRSLRHE
ncbi:ABC transporter permease [Fulvivirgaceae bacterium PWU4]|uniref:ABC transporter permease n=1 Tax=Chryseosolibacter histidini TaxID=2782349 RepID=A0AAP2DKK0_9BACT|nr:ABC transporter permease [Chryseosolibacter histidini]MBT1697841.1 ABC transporter permease [Chryseosolibacter histidini]